MSPRRPIPVLGLLAESIFQPFAVRRRATKGRAGVYSGRRERILRLSANAIGSSGQKPRISRSALGSVRLAKRRTRAEYYGRQRTRAEREQAVRRRDAMASAAPNSTTRGIVVHNGLLKPGSHRSPARCCSRPKQQLPALRKRAVLIHLTGRDRYAIVYNGDHHRRPLTWTAPRRSPRQVEAAVSAPLSWYPTTVATTQHVRYHDPVYNQNRAARCVGSAGSSTLTCREFFL